MIRLEWGLQPPEGYEGVAWGARAIYRFDAPYTISSFGAVRTQSRPARASIDLLWDRQSAVGSPEEIKALTATLNERGLAELREACERESIHGDEARRVRIEVGDYIIEADPRESFGYLYIVAYRRDYVNRPTADDATLLESYIPPTNMRHPATAEPGYDGDEMAAQARSIQSLRSAVKPFDYNPAHTRSTPFEPSTISNVEPEPYRCNVPMCGESGVCAECRRRGAK